MENLKTTLHLYSYDTGKPDEKAQYKELCRDLRGMGLRCFESHGGIGHYETGKKIGDGSRISLETKHLFGNQWNTAPCGESLSGYRVFDWCQDYFDNRQYKTGYWLEQTAKMQEIRAGRYVCGYCGRQVDKWTVPVSEGPAGTFCMQCIDSEYLRESELYLTRMVPVMKRWDKDALVPLSDAEKAMLLPLYKKAQLHGVTERGKARLAKQRADIGIAYEKAVRVARIEFEAKTWLLDHGIRLDNVIYYSHADIFCFGWRKPLEGEELSAWLDIASEFPFNYEIKKT